MHPPIRPHVPASEPIPSHDKRKYTRTYVPGRTMTDTQRLALEKAHTEALGGTAEAAEGKSAAAEMLPPVFVQTGLKTGPPPVAPPEVKPYVAPNMVGMFVSPPLLLESHPLSLTMVCLLPQLWVSPNSLK